jgi:hypothetical protein
MPIVINNQKVTGILQAAVTQPTDSVPLSLFNDLSGYVYTLSGGTFDTSAIKQSIADLSAEVQDLSAYVYSLDLSGIVQDISDISYNLYDLSAYVYSLDLSGIVQDISDISYNLYDLSAEVQDLSAYVYSLSGGSINIGSYTDNSSQIYPNIDTVLFDASSFSLDVSGSVVKIDVSGGGGGGGGGDVTIADLSYLFFNKPLISTDCSAFSTNSTNIFVNWKPPSQTKAAFNFFDATPSYNNTLNYLPYINDIIIGYKNTNASSPTWTDITYSSGVTNSSSFIPTLINQLNLVSTQSSPSNPVATTNISPNGKVTIQVPFIVGSAYIFRIAYTNNSSDTSWNYLYCPDGSGIPFGNPGPALPPDSIAFDTNSDDYNELKIGGEGGLYMDASINVPYGSSTLSIGYGVDISGQRSNYSVQIGGNSTNNYLFDASQGWPATNYNKKFWGFPSGNPQGAGTNLDIYAFPEYVYNTKIGTYYAVNSAEDFSSQLVPAPSSVKTQAGVVIPSRSTVTNNYNQFLDSKIFNPLNTDGYSTTDAISRVNYNNSYSVYFLQDNSSINFSQSGVYNLAANFGEPKTYNQINGSLTHGDIDISFVAANSMLGKSCSGEDITYIYSYVDDQNSNKIIDLSSTTRVGFTGNDNNSQDSNTYLTISSSKTIDLSNGIDITRTEGYYLGFDVSSIKLRDISLGIIPDICNNGYSPYEWNINQILYKQDGNIDIKIPSNSLSLSLAKKPEISTEISNNFSVSTTNPSLNGTKQLYGLPLPTDSNNDLKFNVTCDIDNLHPIWAPNDATTSNSLYDLTLYYDPCGTPFSTDETSSSWSVTGVNETFSVNKTLMVDYTGLLSGTDYANFPYSRDISNAAGNQFKIELNIKNNVTLTPNPSDQRIVQNDLSGNGKAWWWDFTFNNGSSQYTPYPEPQTGATNIPNLTVTGLSNTSPRLNTLVNVFDISTGQATTLGGYNMTASINNYTAMWCNGGWVGDNSSNTITASNYPYIDYSGNFYNPSNVMKDYSIFDSSGLTQTIKYDINYYWTGNGSLLTKSYTNLKFLIIRLSNTVNSLNMNVVIKDKSDTTLDKGDDYVLFYQEELQSGASAYTWNTVGTKPYSPWLDCANKNVTPGSLNYFALAQSGTNNGIQNGIWSTNSGGYIRRINTANAIYQYLAIGINRGKTVKSINISYA